MLKKFLFITFLGFSSLNSLAKDKCPARDPIYISLSSWESTHFAAHVHKYLYENLFEDCQVELLDSQPLSTVALIMSQRIDIIPEIWYNSINMFIQDALSQNKIRILSNIYEKADEGWFIPQYVSNQYPELTHANDLLEYRHKLSTKKQPIPVYNCPDAWTCHNITRHLFRAYGLEGEFELVNPSSEKELEEKIIHSYLLRKPFVTYYWSPTPLLGALKMKQLEMNPFNAQDYKCIVEKECENPKPISFARTDVLTGVSDTFYKKSPEIIEIIKKLQISAQDVSDVLNWKATHKRSYPQTVQYFFRNYPHIWKTWLNKEQIRHIEESLLN